MKPPSRQLHASPRLNRPLGRRLNRRRRRRLWHADVGVALRGDLITTPAALLLLLPGLLLLGRPFGCGRVSTPGKAVCGGVACAGWVIREAAQAVGPPLRLAVLLPRPGFEDAKLGHLA